ncbi:SDR family NAD(P)-dependent oxidoreductase [Paracoccus sp. JM45]|uniref:SDR family NAD(P)-dependent oxidoreductase n=1 Tax=Paracoccus sp. JM45 TaxID=2283626 RepID=UPI000E6D0463|nr:SDR family NAD(P)-dependent oxidoreductase [Paracoccus sp. JM45]RJE81103.1 SDR family NAD(P)-dependent oxidoreductase [Paracoccus sp. JM45]
MKTILITGATQGLGKATAHALAKAGHALIIHGRDAAKLAETAKALKPAAACVTTHIADLSDLTEVAAMASRIRDAHPQIDVLINNAGVFKTAQPVAHRLDVRFTVNTLASALLARLLLPAIPQSGRIIHLSSAAQSPVDPQALTGEYRLQDIEAYAQSKLAITLWNQKFGQDYPDGPLSLAVNPGSLLATRMVREGFGTAGNDVETGVDILTRAALSDEFTGATGRYYDNDAGRLAPPYSDVVVRDVTARIDALLADL